MSNNVEVAFGLLENGLDFILSSTNHLSKSLSKADIKYGILHLSSGIELVLKYRLSKEHWSLLFQDIDKASRDSFESGDFKSVDFESCISRLKKISSLEIKDEDCNNLKLFKKKRNKFEHFNILDSEIALKSYSTKVLSFIIDFIDEYIPKEDIKDSESEILDKIRQNLVKFNEFVKHRLEEIKPILDSSKYSPIVVCPICFQETLEIDNGAKCYFCNYNGTGYEVAENFINNVLGIDKYSCIKDGGDYPLYICPNCGLETFVYSDTDTGLNSWICFSCGNCYDYDDIDFCSVCNEPFLCKEDSGNICDDCFKAKIEQE
jgi:hypothetical protein